MAALILANGGGLEWPVGSKVKWARYNPQGGRRIVTGRVLVSDVRQVVAEADEGGIDHMIPKAVLGTVND